MGFKNYQESLKHNDTALSKVKAGNFIGFKTAVLAYLDRMNEAREYLSMYLSMRPNLKTEKDFGKLFLGEAKITTIVFLRLIESRLKPEV